MKRHIGQLLILTLLMSAAGLASCGGGGGGGGNAPSSTISFTNPNGSQSPSISVEVVRTPEERSLGLMYRKELDPESGMLFLFPEEQPLSFWMKNTYLELDMIFMDRNFEVVSIVERAVPLTETPRRSAAPAQYVLEVLGGSAAKWGITAGSSGHASALPEAK